MYTVGRHPSSIAAQTRDHDTYGLQVIFIWVGKYRAPSECTETKDKTVIATMYSLQYRVRISIASACIILRVASVLDACVRRFLINLDFICLFTFCVVGGRRGREWITKRSAVRENYK